jgi:hypothetical protein
MTSLASSRHSAEARASYAAALAIAERLAKAEPSNILLQQDLDALRTEIAKCCGRIH